MTASQFEADQWHIFHKKDVQWKLTMKEAMSQAWMHMVCAFLDYNQEEIKNIDKENNNLPWNKVEPDASLDALGKLARCPMDALFTLFFKEKYNNKDQSSKTRDDKFNWFCLITQDARLHGYKQYRDGRQMRVTGHMTRIHPTSHKTFDSFFNIGVTSQHSGECLLQGLDSFNHVKNATIISMANNTILKTLNNYDGNKVIQTNWTK